MFFHHAHQPWKKKNAVGAGGGGAGVTCLPPRAQFGIFFAGRPLPLIQYGPTSNLFGTMTFIYSILFIGI